MPFLLLLLYFGLNQVVAARVAKQLPDFVSRHLLL